MSPPWTATALALGAAVSLGLARFSYALLLSPMRADLGWSYTTAGAMNTVNAAGYLIGALLAPRWLARHDARALMLGGMLAVAVLLAAHAAATVDTALYLLRGLTGVASAATFISGGLLAAQLAGAPPASAHGHASVGLVLGLYYGGTGAGIVASALLVPPLTDLPVSALPGVAGWRWAWAVLAGVALLATAVAARATRALSATAAATGARTPFDWQPFGFGLAAYLMFGLGYIGYMTFVITLLREQQLPAAQIVAFYALLGVGVIASSWLWAALLQRQRGGVPLALLNGLLALATLLPVLSSQPLAVFASGALFGSVFLSLVASTTALVRHNLPPAAWPGGIAAFTIVFAAGQIVGPTLVGWIADGPGGLARGFLVSAAALAVGSLLATRQRALAAPGLKSPAPG
jgi:predicted MFS family arabinose efflux permease